MNTSIFAQDLTPMITQQTEMTPTATDLAMISRSTKRQRLSNNQEATFPEIKTPTPWEPLFGAHTSPALNYHSNSRFDMESEYAVEIEMASDSEESGEQYKLSATPTPSEISNLVQEILRDHRSLDILQSLISSRSNQQS
eukprot:TRINITY_DN6534_c0_g1_i1.p1 TRINITY_DN6534_c0_g1~~TRINITY_DN6534_c0_g1_i1.p1  ORF type:complete len:140 (-),score=21.94 TRINITY_DN6534_c0_g1_i1:186-605(-)